MGRRKFFIITRLKDEIEISSIYLIPFFRQLYFIVDFISIFYHRHHHHQQHRYHLYHTVFPFIFIIPFLACFHRHFFRNLKVLFVNSGSLLKNCFNLLQRLLLYFLFLLNFPSSCFSSPRHDSFSWKVKINLK